MCVLRKPINDDNRLISATCSFVRYRAGKSIYKSSPLWSARLSAQSKSCSGPSEHVLSLSPQVIHVLIEFVHGADGQIIGRSE